MIIDEFNMIIKTYGIDKMYMRICTVWDDIELIYCYSGEEQVMYKWDDEEDFIYGTNTKYSIFELCKEFVCYGSAYCVFYDNDCFEFCKLVSGCETFDEIRLKMQLMGL
jgi:hypothetical protein